MMKVILREDVANLGKAGELVTVRNGYGRNFLLPRSKAVLATEGNVRQIDHEKRVSLARQAKMKGEATNLAQRLAALQIVITRRVGEQDKLYGSVTALDIHEKIAEAKLPVDRRQIHLAEPLKSLGTFEVPVRLHADVTQNIKVTVAAE
jgi:large subunit ribosomal protein L9